MGKIKLEYTYMKYVEGVLSGEIVAGELIKQACRRFLALRADQRYEFRELETNAVIKCTSLFKHSQGASAGQRFILEPWQQFIVASIYGFYVKETGKRLVRSVYVEVARKNGKTALAAALCLYHLIADKEPSPHVYLAANGVRQVQDSAWPIMENFLRGFDPEQEMMTRYRDKVTRTDDKTSYIQVLAAEPKRLDGRNPAMWVLDEYHEARNTAMRDVLLSGQAQRKNPMGIIITTAGFNLLLACYEHRQMCIEIISGAKVDDSTFAAIFSMDEGDDWKDEKNWVKANPNLGVTVEKDFLADCVRLAENSGSAEVGVKTKNFNIWCASSETWIPHTFVANACKDKVTPSDYKYCYVGVDLSSVCDLTAVAALFAGDDGRLYFKCWYYLPQAALDVGDRFSTLYRKWAHAGELRIQSGNAVDYDEVLTDILLLNKECRIYKVGYDPWNAQQFAIDGTAAGLKMEKYSQTIANFTKPTKEFERLIREGKVSVDRNDCTLHCFQNVELIRDHNGNVKPSKRVADKKVDGVIAMLCALGTYLETPKYNNKIF